MRVSNRKQVHDTKCCRIYIGLNSNYSRPIHFRYVKLYRVTHDIKESKTLNWWQVICQTFLLKKFIYSIHYELAAIEEHLSVCHDCDSSSIRHTEKINKFIFFCRTLNCDRRLNSIIISVAQLFLAFFIIRLYTDSYNCEVHFPPLHGFRLCWWDCVNVSLFCSWRSTWSWRQNYEWTSSAFRQPVEQTQNNDDEKVKIHSFCLFVLPFHLPFLFPEEGGCRGDIFDINLMNVYNSRGCGRGPGCANSW